VLADLEEDESEENSFFDISLAIGKVNDFNDFGLLTKTLVN
jgi:hypothetical protein